MSREGIHQRIIRETPIAILDFETTGLNPGSDRVVEASVLRLEPNRQGTMVFDSLINPLRPMAATEIHGITDADVADAPAFADVAAEFVNALAGCVVASYNVYFDIRFLEYELLHSGFKALPPHLCLMYLRPMLGLGARCSLMDACRCHGLAYADAHAAGNDAQAAAQLMEIYLDVMSGKSIATFKDLAQLRAYKFVRSFAWAPFHALQPAPTGNKRLKPRTSRAAVAVAAEPEPRGHAETEQESGRRALHTYWDALKTVIADLRVTDAEVRYLEEKKLELQLPPERIRVLHARAFMNVLSRFSTDEWLDDK